MGKTFKDATTLSTAEKMEVLERAIDKSTYLSDEEKAFYLECGPYGNFCILSSYGWGSKKGYIKVSYHNYNYKLHTVAGLLNPVNQNRDLTGLEASHICENKRCFNIEHIYFESDSVNKSRLCCTLFLGVKQNYTCPHTPACIDPTFRVNEE